MRLFDYAFYSLYRLYLAKEGRNSNPVYSATMAIAALKVMALLGFGILMTPFYDGPLSQNLGIDKTTLKIIFVVLGLIYAVFLYKSYKSRLPEILKKYKDHPRNKWFRAWMLYFVAIGFVLIPILLVKMLKALQ